VSSEARPPGRALGEPKLGRPKLQESRGRYLAHIDLHAGEQIIFEGHPSWRATLAFYLQGLLAIAIVGVIVGLIADWGIGAVVLVAGAALVVLGGFLKRMATVYTITNQRLRIKRGILAKKVQQTRIDRVQNVNTEQSVLDRLLRVGKVDFDTAGTDDSDFTFDGVSSPSRVVEAVDRAQHSAAAAATEQHGQPQQL
jgi:uncharacterized membrane protein YdbT with pleckstrin-like domain